MPRETPQTNRTPLQIVLIRDRNEPRTVPYVAALRLAFEGTVGTGEPNVVYLGDGVDLGIRVLDVRPETSDSDLQTLRSGAVQTIFVVVDPLPKPPPWLGDVENPIIETLSTPPARDYIQAEPSPQGREPALAPVVTALRTMQRARQLLAQSIVDAGGTTGSLKFFISHAKADGAAMARSLIGILKQLQEADGDGSGFSYFYDAENLEPGARWKEVLDAEAKQSVLIALRTHDYDRRKWCRREYLHAERNGMPILVVDLRTAQYRPSALLPFDTAPTVQIHDGNLFRVVLHAMAAHLRVLRVQCKTASTTKVLPHRPSVYSLDGAMRTGQARAIAYPGPEVPRAFKRAVEPILNQRKPPIELKPLGIL